MHEGGTTHPFESTRVFTESALDLGTGDFRLSEAAAKFYVVSDNVRSKGLTADDAMDRLPERA